MNNKVAILGKCSTKLMAPFNDMTFDIWTMNYHKDASLLRRIDLWFDIHSTGANPRAEITRWTYPFDEVEQMLGGNYINNTASYMIAYAVLKGYKQIWLYGMRFTNDIERRREEYKNVRELIFFAKGRGVDVYAPYDPIMLKEYEHYGI